MIGVQGCQVLIPRDGSEAAKAFVLRTVSRALKYLCELSSVRARRMFVRNHLKHDYPVVRYSKVYHMLGEQTDLRSWIA